MANLQDANELIKADVFGKTGLGPGMVLGDLGCGNLAFYTITGARVVGKNGVVYAVDILKSVLEAVSNRVKQEGLENIITVWSNLEVVGGAKIPSDSLDVALIHNVLFHSKKPELIIKEAARLLKLGGRLMIVDWLKVKSPFGPPLEDRPDPNNLKNICQKTGLKTVEDFQAGPYHFGLIYSK
ncbi:MAG: methyltransferase domain-containing protein [Patescibacteria group bacterium]